MSILLPAMIYKSPGINKKPGGGTYDYICVETQDVLDEKLAEGWFLSSSEAVDYAGNKANGIKKLKQKLAIKPTKEKKASKPLSWRHNVSSKIDPDLDQDLDTARPTRDELKAKAAELGIKFHHRLTDKNLGELIDDKLMAENKED
jgi:hypothetical protein